MKWSVARDAKEEAAIEKLYSCVVARSEYKTNQLDVLVLVLAKQ